MLRDFVHLSYSFLNVPAFGQWVATEHLHWLAAFQFLCQLLRAALDDFAFGQVVWFGH